MQKYQIDFDNKIVLCFYEGNAEKEILEMLLENKKLKFTEDDLYDKEFKERVSVKTVEKKYLSLSFDKPVIILRVIDSKKEKFNLSTLYKNRFNEIYVCRTAPEIEYLLIMYHHDEEKFNKEKSHSHIRACQFCKKYYGYSKTATEEYFKKHLSIKELLDVLKRYDNNHSDEYTIYSLVKD